MSKNNNIPKLKLKDLPVFKAEDLPKMPSEITESEAPAKTETDEEAPTQTEAVRRALVQELTFGAGEEISAGIKAAAEELGKEDKSLEDLKGLYQKYRDIERQREKAVEEAFPKTYLGTSIAGGIASSFLPSGALGLAAKGLGKLKMAQKAQQAASAAKLLSPTTLKGSAIMGAVSGLGRSEADLTEGQIGQAAVSTGLGAGVGAGGFKVGEAVSKFFSPKELEKKAATHMADVLGIEGLPSTRERLGLDILKSGRVAKGIGEESLEAVQAGKKQLMDSELEAALKAVPPDERMSALEKMADKLTPEQMKEAAKVLKQSVEMPPLSKEVGEAELEKMAKALGADKLTQAKKFLEENEIKPIFNKISQTGEKNYRANEFLEKLANFQNEILRLGQKSAASETRDTFLKGVLPDIQFNIENIKANKLNLQGLQDIKTELRKAAKNFSEALKAASTSGDTLSPEFMAKTAKSRKFLELSNLIQDYMVETAERAEPGLGKKLLDINQMYHSLSEAESGLKKRLIVKGADAEKLGMPATRASLTEKALEGLYSTVRDPLKLKAAQLEMGTAEFFKKFPKAAKALEQTAQIAPTKVTSEKIGGVIEQGISGIGSLFPEKKEKEEKKEESKPTSSREPASQSKFLMDQNPEQLSEMLNQLKQSSELSDSVEKIEEAVNERDNVAKNARLMALIQDPKKRAIINKFISSTKELV